MDDLVRLAELIQTRNAVTSEIAALIGRPAQLGHIGEYIASRILGIVLEESASQKSIDGHFTYGELAGHTVNIKWYTKQEGLLALNVEHLPDFYLVLAGPKAGASSSRGTVRPWVIEAVYLFDAHKLLSVLLSRGIKISEATSVRRHLWDEAEIYPVQQNTRLMLSEEQRALWEFFRRSVNGAG